jgi:CRP/FNR family transcriptional regulator, cyclic AMP receptor protein
MADAPIELLERIPLFEDLSKDDLKRVSRSFKERRFSPGDTVAEEGTGGVGFFIIGEGTANVEVQGERRGQLAPGDYFGEVALIDDQARRTATVTAETDLVCYGLTPWEFRPLVETNAEIAWKLLQVMARRLRESEQQHAPF